MNLTEPLSSGKSYSYGVSGPVAAIIDALLSMVYNNG
jgi:hypothetical protein